MSRFTVLLGGDMSLTPRAAAQVAGTRAIAADSGMRHASLLGLTPELWVGDFDSVPDDLIAEWPSVPREVFPTGKDQTDGELAVRDALSRGATELVLAGAFGGARADHSHLHLTLAVRLAEERVPVLLTSGRQEGLPILPGSADYNFAEGTMFSILCFTDLADLTVKGARWPLDHVAVPFGSSLTISNEVRGRLSVDLGSGRALLVAHPFPGKDF